MFNDKWIQKHADIRITEVIIIFFLVFVFEN